MENVIIIGAGGHGQVVADILLCMNHAGKQIQPIGYIDDNPDSYGHTYLNLPVLGSISHLDQFQYDSLIIAVGSNRVRKSIVEQLAADSVKFATAIHPSAIIGSNVNIGEGTMICANAVINVGTSIGKHVILNTACTVDHHNQVNSFVHLAPGTHTGGDVVIHEGSFIGIGSTIKPRIIVEKWTTIGGGSFVRMNTLPESIIGGVPAQLLA